MKTHKFNLHVTSSMANEESLLDYLSKAFNRIEKSANGIYEMFIMGGKCGVEVVKKRPIRYKIQIEYPTKVAYCDCIAYNETEMWLKFYKRHNAKNIKSVSIYGYGVIR